MATHDADGNPVFYAPSAMVSCVFQNLLSAVSSSGQLDYVAEPVAMTIRGLWDV